MDKILETCLTPDPNWWALLSIGCGIFIVGMALGALIGAALAYEAMQPRIIYPEEEDRLVR